MTSKKIENFFYQFLITFSLLNRSGWVIPQKNHKIRYICIFYNRFMVSTAIIWYKDRSLWHLNAIGFYLSRKKNNQIHSTPYSSIDSSTRNHFSLAEGKTLKLAMVSQVIWISSLYKTQKLKREIIFLHSSFICILIEDFLSKPQSL